MSKDRLDSFSKFYSKENLEIDDLLIEIAFNEYQKYFNGRTCLELGPANGLMTRFLHESFEKLDLVEGSESLLKIIPEYPNVVKHHSLFNEFIPQNKYDTIIMNHVLEHLEHPVNELRNIRKWLESDGTLICGVPNANSFHRLIAVELGMLSAPNELNSRDLELGHYRVYDLKKLIKDVELAGFKVIFSGGIGLKFLSNSQMSALLDYDFIKVSLSMGSLTPENGALVFVIAKINN